jgi:sarcosine oxidase
MAVPEGRFYGFPVYGIPGFKIGKYHHLKQLLDQPGQIDREIHPEDEEVLRAGIQRYFPDANGPTMAMKTCLFTNSPDEHFILDHHPDSANVCMAAGFSGHGYKFCSVVGEIMADLALEGGTRHEISEFSLKRFDEKGSSLSETKPS